METDKDDEIEVDEQIVNPSKGMIKESEKIVKENMEIDSYQEEIVDRDHNEELLVKPEFVTYGCYMKVRKEKENKILTYHIPLESDKSRTMWGIEERMLGKKVGHRMFLASSWYELIEFGWEENFRE